MSKPVPTLEVADQRHPPATRYVTLRGDYGTANFVMHRGGILKEVVVAYEAWGTLSDNHDNVVLVFGGLSPSAHACSSPQDPSRGWWEYMIGSGKPIDTDKFMSCVLIHWVVALVPLVPVRSILIAGMSMVWTSPI